MLRSNPGSARQVPFLLSDHMFSAIFIDVLAGEPFPPSLNVAKFGGLRGGCLKSHLALRPR